MLAFDPEWTWAAGSNRLRGFRVFHDLKPLKDFLRTHLRSPFRAHYMPRFYPEVHLLGICQLLSEVGNLTLAIDEVANFSEFGKWLYFKQAKELPQWLGYYARCGRHPKVSYVWTSQRPADVSRQLTTMTQHLNIFYLEESEKWLRERGMNEAQALAVSQLPPRRYFSRVDGEWQVYGG